jgi:hypothetical protein
MKFPRRPRGAVRSSRRSRGAVIVIHTVATHAVDRIGRPAIRESRE